MEAEDRAFAKGRLFCYLDLHCRLRRPKRGEGGFQGHAGSMKDGRNVDIVTAQLAYLHELSSIARSTEGRGGSLSLVKRILQRLV